MYSFITRVCLIISRYKSHVHKRNNVKNDIKENIIYQSSLLTHIPITVGLKYVHNIEIPSWIFRQYSHIIQTVFDGVSTSSNFNYHARLYAFLKISYNFQDFFCLEGKLYLSFAAIAYNTYFYFNTTEDTLIRAQHLIKTNA